VKVRVTLRPETSVTDFGMGSLHYLCALTHDSGWNVQVYALSSGGFHFIRYEKDLRTIGPRILATGALDLAVLW